MKRKGSYLIWNSEEDQVYSVKYEENEERKEMFLGKLIVKLIKYKYWNKFSDIVKTIVIYIKVYLEDI